MAEITVNIYGQIGKMEGEQAHPEGNFTFTDLAKAIASMGEGDTLTAVIDSVGGYVDEAFRIARKLEEIGATTVAKRVYSAANILFFAGAKREIDANSKFMLHNSRIDPLQLAGFGAITASDLERIGNDLKQGDALMRGYIAQRTGIADTTLIGLMDVDRFINSDEALALGFAKAMRVPSVLATYSQKQNNSMTFEQAKALLTVFIGGKAKAVSVELADGKTLEVEGEGDLMGNPAFIGGSVAPDDTYMLKDGRRAKVMGGKVVELEAAPMATGGDTDLQAKVAELEAKLQAMEQEKVAKVAELTAKNTEMEAKYIAVAKAMVSQGMPTTPTAGTGNAGKEATPTYKPTHAEQLIDKIKNQKK